MFPIVLNEKISDFQSQLRLGNHYQLPLGCDKYQFEVKAVSELYDLMMNNGEMASSYFYQNGSFCFYCGEKTNHIVPCFLQDGSGINLWLLEDIRSSYLICNTCCSHAGKLTLRYNRKLKDVRKGAFTSLLKYEPDLLLPTVEPVDLHFIYENNGLLKAKTKRALKTIETFALNRSELVVKRKNIFNMEFTDDTVYNQAIDIEPLYCYIMLKISIQMNPLLPDLQVEFASTVGTRFYQNHRSDITKVKHKNSSFVKIDSDVNPNEVHSSPLGLKSLRFNRIRNFESDQSIEFKGKNSILLLGENGVGKSTLIKLLEKAAKPRSILNIASFITGEVSYSELSPSVSLHYLNGDRAVQFQANRRMLGQRDNCNVIRIPEHRISNLQIEKFSHWLISYSEDVDLMNWIARKLKLLLELSNDFYFYTQDRQCYWLNRQNHGIKYLDDFSSGYRSLMNIFFLIVSKLYVNQGNTISNLENSLASTLVLIDEIELHLHPRLKMRIVGAIQEAFPQVLFVISTHDPLVIKSANAETNILLLKENEYFKTEIIDGLPPHRDLTTEQILTSPFFGLDSTSAQRKDSNWDNYQKALKNKDMETASQLRKELADSGLFGVTYRDYLAFTAVDAYLAKNIVPTSNQIVDFIESVENKDA
jgi:predicted ATPase